MKIGKLFIGRKTNDEIMAEKQRYLRAVRAGGYGRVAQREQRRLDALNRKNR
jgi:hypothetical protein